MKRILSLLLVVMLLWCASVFAGTAQVEFEQIFYPFPIWYTVKGTDARGFEFEIRLISHHSDKFREKENTSEAERFLQNDADGDLRSMDVTSILLRKIGLASYEQGKLSTLQVFENNSLQRIYVIGTEKELYDYPQDGKPTLLSYLLNAETTVEAAARLQSLIGEDLTSETCDLLKAELEKEYLPDKVEPVPEPVTTPAWVLPTAICGGAVVLAAAVAVPTVIIRRKKRGAAVTDTPAEEEMA